jgi:hypothetical protein
VQKYFLRHFSFIIILLEVYNSTEEEKCKSLIFCPLFGKPEGKRPLGRPRRRWEDNLRRDLWEIGVEGDWILLAQDRVRWRALVISVMNLRVW